MWERRALSPPFAQEGGQRRQEGKARERRRVTGEEVDCHGFQLQPTGQGFKIKAGDLCLLSLQQS